MGPMDPSVWISIVSQIHDSRTFLFQSTWFRILCWFQICNQFCSMLNIKEAIATFPRQLFSCRTTANPWLLTNTRLSIFIQDNLEENVFCIILTFHHFLCKILRWFQICDHFSSTINGNAATEDFSLPY